jgi:hypothetical protein
MAEKTRQVQPPQLEIEYRQWFPIPQMKPADNWFPLVSQAVSANGYQLRELRKWGNRMLWGIVSKDGVRYAILVMIPKSWVE